ncbi:MAG: hypothetical protein KME05_00395 [Gloeocapsa sp. UFS-A4-WI-NPMV-4B04]|jgi:hypothetical protein|nr:hypothetical protein [Gloeocapsa sp. UFS-A4-WI-NPMV-4B04]
MLAILFAAGTFILTPLQNQHAQFCQMLEGEVYSAATDTCTVKTNTGSTLEFVGEDIGNVKYTGACDGMVPVKECTAEF